MQIYVNQQLAQHTFIHAPTIKTTTFTVADVPVRIETFDYGTPMGWGDHANVVRKGGDIRRRVFVDGNLIPRFSEQIRERKRPAWLPKKISITAWNQLMQPSKKNEEAFLRQWKAYAEEIEVNPRIAETKEFTQWAIDNSDLILEGKLV